MFTFMHLGDVLFFFSKSEEIMQEVATTEMTLKTTSSEVKEVKSQLQALEIELQAQLSMVRPQRHLMLTLQQS